MRVIPIAAPVLALGALLGGLTAVSDVPEPAKHTAAAVVLVPNTVVSGTDGNNGNG
ncbi:hypothetical protein ACIQOW_11900 [Kitasatospora sp. NPDC091335]|uniref:hypothetical protein n=1 Tax=Streptomycetaceae TaxID=2062 RepID=UPI0016621A8F|nr:hypothetical protein [Streptomyces sp. CBMA156]